MGDYIRERRLLLGMTQTDLSEKSGVAQPTISDLERNRTSRSNADVRRRIAGALRVRHVDLLVAAGELIPEEVDGAAIAAPFPPNSPGARIVDLMHEMSDDELGLVLLYADKVQRLYRKAEEMGRGPSVRPMTKDAVS